MPLLGPAHARQFDLGAVAVCGPAGDLVQRGDEAENAKPCVFDGSHGGLRSRVPLFRLNAPQEKGRAYNRSQREAELELCHGDEVHVPR